MKKLLFCFSFLTIMLSGKAQVIFSEDFDGVGGPTAGGAGTYTFPAGWLLRNSDNLTPDASVAYVNAAWERREDFSFNVADSCAFSTSWYAPTGTANDWMWTPSFTVLPNTMFSWNAVTYDAQYPDGYEVRIMTQSSTPGGPTGGNGVLGNQVSNSTILFSTGAENTTWTTRNVSLNAYAGQTVWIAFRNNSLDKFLLLIDDVKAEVQVNYDLQTVAGSVSHGPYTVAPSTHLTTAQNFELRGTIQNMGMLGVTNAQLKCNVYLNGILNTTVSSATTTSLASGASEVKTIAFTPTLDGTYDFEFFADMTETDQVVNNDTISDPISLIVDPSLMRRDDGTVVGGLGIGAGGNGYLGQTFNFETAVNIESISTYFTRGYTGKQLAALIYNTNGSGVPTTLVASTDTLLYIDDSARLYTMPFANGLSLPAGKYAILQFEFDSTLQVGQTTNIFQNNTVFVAWTGQSFAPLESFGPSFAKSLVIWPNFNVCVGLVGGTLSGQTQASCGGSDGSATMTLEPGFNITWSDNSTNATLQNVPAGTYTCVIDNGSCQFYDTIFITNPNAPIVALDSISDALCNGGLGLIDLSISGGTAPFTIQWTNNASTDSLINTPAGTYDVIVTDDNNCIGILNGMVINEPTSLAVTNTVQAESCASCNDGFITLDISGGAAPYVIAWSNGANTDSIGGLIPGTYTVTVTDANGCSINDSFVVDQFNALDELANVGIYVFPNPSSDFVTVNTNGSVILTIELIDASGKSVLKNAPNQVSGTCSVAAIDPGTYFLIITTNDGVHTGKITKL